MAKPTPEDFERVTAAVIRSLPDSIAQRRGDLRSLIAVLPQSFEHRARAAELLELIEAGERKQMNFLQSLNGGAR